MRFFTCLALSSSLCFACGEATTDDANSPNTTTSSPTDDEEKEANEDESQDDETPKEPEVTPDVAITPSIPTLSADQEGVVRVTGSIEGNTIDMTWDFKQPNPKKICNGVESILTNGGLFAQVGSSTSQPTISVSMDNDAGTNNCSLGTDDWFVRLTIGNINKTTAYANVKDAFQIPPRPYTMITVYQGPARAHERRHKEKDTTNTALTAKIDSLEYTAADQSLRVKGAARGEWNSTDHIELHFNILVGGSDDRHKNNGSLNYVHEKGGY